MPHQLRGHLSIDDQHELAWLQGRSGSRRQRKQIPSTGVTEQQSHLHLGLLNTNHMSRPTMDVRPKRRPPSSIPQISLPAPVQQWTSPPCVYLSTVTLQTSQSSVLGGASILQMHGWGPIQIPEKPCNLGMLGV